MIMMMFKGEGMIKSLGNEPPDYRWASHHFIAYPYNILRCKHRCKQIKDLCAILLKINGVVYT
jgi:hypothetical protein